MILDESNCSDVATWTVACQPETGRHAIYTGKTIHYGWRALDNGVHLNHYEMAGWQVVGMLRRNGELERFE